MATLKLVEKLKPCIQHLEGFISSAKSRDDLANLLNESVGLLRTLFHLSSSLPSLSVSNDALYQKASYIFENGIWVIDSIAQFQVNDADPTLEKLRNLRYVLEESIPELKEVGLHSCTQSFDVKLDLSCEDQLARCLRIITNAMRNILEVLKCFQGAFFMCKEASAFVEEFSVVWPQLKDIITQLESTAITSHGQTITTFSSTLDRLFKISMNALWLLFSFPETEHKEFEVIISLCHNAIQIFARATDILNRLVQFFLKDSSKLKALLDGLSQSIQAVHTHCGEIFELKCGVDIFENVCDQKCNSVDILKNTAVNNEIVLRNLPGEEQKRVDISDTAIGEAVGQDSKESTSGASASQNLCSLESMVVDNSIGNECMSPLKSTAVVGDAVISQSSCNTDGINSSRVQTVPLSTNSYEGTSVSLEGVSALMTASSMSSGSTKKEVKTAVVSEINPVSERLSSSGLLQNLRDVKFNLLVPSQQKMLERIMRKYKCHLDHFSICKITQFQFFVMCKLCGVTLPMKNVKEHIDYARHQQNLYKKFKVSQGAGTVISIVLKIHSASDSPHLNTLCIDFHDVKFNLLNLSQRKALEKVIKKIRHDINHFSFTIKTTKSEFLVLCNVCGKTLLTESIKAYKRSANFQQNYHTTYESSVASCTAMPEISIDKWQFLNFLPDARHRCSLCAATLASSTDPFVEYIHSVIHRSKLKLENPDLAEGNVLNLVGFAHFFHNLLNTNFASLEVSLKQHVVKSGVNRLHAVNSFTIVKKQDLAELQFSCHSCDWSMLWKNTVDHDMMSHNDWHNISMQDEVLNYGPVEQNDDPWRNYSGTVQVLQNMTSCDDWHDVSMQEEVLNYGPVEQNNDPWGNYLGRAQFLEKDLYVLWCKELVHNLNAKLPIIQDYTFPSASETGYPNSPDYSHDYLQLPDRFMY